MPDSTPEWTKVDEFLEKKKEEIPMYTPITREKVLAESRRWGNSLHVKLDEGETYELSNLIWTCLDPAQQEIVRLNTHYSSLLKQATDSVNEKSEEIIRQGEEIERLRLGFQIANKKLDVGLFLNLGQTAKAMVASNECKELESQLQILNNKKG